MYKQGFVTSLVTSTLLACFACDASDDPGPTVFRGQVVWADDQTPAPDAMILYTGTRDRGIGQAQDWVVDDTASVDEFGNFDFTVPGGDGSVAVEEITLGVYFGDYVEPDSLYGQSDLIFPPHITDRIKNLGTYFPPGETYELTIGLPR